MQIWRTTYFGSRLILCRKLGLENRGKYVLVMFEIFFIRIKSPTHPTQEKWVRTNQPRPFLRLPAFFWPSCQALWQSQEAWKCVSKRGGRCLRLRTFFFRPSDFLSISDQHWRAATTASQYCSQSLRLHLIESEKMTTHIYEFFNCSLHIVELIDMLLPP